MKFLRLLIIALILVSCNSTATKKDNTDTSINKLPTSKKFFDYDKIDYYFGNNLDDMEELYANRHRSQIDSFKMGVILDDIPADISDISFIEKLETIGYKKSSIDPSMFTAIDKIFIENPVKDIVKTSCIPIYRDIMIFKKNEKVIGTSKICLGCYDHQIHGTSANTEYFGQNGDYKKLEKLLKASNNR